MKKTRSCDSTPDRTEDCDKGGSLLSRLRPSYKRSQAHHNCRGLISGEFVLCEILYPLARRGALFIDARERAKVIDV